MSDSCFFIDKEELDKCLSNSIEIKNYVLQNVFKIMTVKPRMKNAKELAVRLVNRHEVEEEDYEF